MPDWYEPALTDRTSGLYRQVREFADDRSDVSVIGGVAVWEMVEPGVRVRSRDIDIVLQSEDALWAFQAHFPKWGIAWRRKGRSTFKECRFVDADPFPPVIDVFTTDADIGARLFAMHRSENVVSEMLGQPFLPDCGLLLRMKLRAAPARRGEDAADKGAKDLFDIHNLVFHNVVGKTPMELLAQTDPAERAEAATFLAASRKVRPAFAAQYNALGRWLRSPPKPKTAQI